MKPIKLNFNEMEFSSWIARLNTAKKVAQKLLDEVNTIGSYRLTLDGLKQMMNGRHEQVAAAIEAETVAELNRVGISSQAVRIAAIKGDLEAFYTIANKQLLRTDYEIIEALTISPNSTVNISSTAVERMREQLTHYIRTESGAQLYELHKAAAEAMETFYRAAGVFNNLNFRQAFIWGKADKIVLYPLDYDTAAAAE